MFFVPVLIPIYNDGYNRFHTRRGGGSTGCPLLQTKQGHQEQGKILAKFIKENMEMKAEIRRLNRVVIEDKYMQLLDNDELTQSLND